MTAAYRQVNSMIFRFFLMLVALAGVVAELQAQDDSMIGAWENLTNGDLVGLELQDQEHCNLYIERALKPRTNRACKYEPFEDRFLIFLFNEHGVCNSEADFEFIYQPEAPLLRLMIGGSEIALQKIQQKSEKKPSAATARPSREET